MSEPIDILAIAAERRHAASEAWSATRYMQASKDAEFASALAWSDLVLASSDLARAQRLITELGCAA